MTEEEIRNLFIVNPLSAVRALQEENAALRAEITSKDADYKRLEAERDALREEADKWKTLYYECQEWVCSCNRTGDPMTEYICQWHRKKPNDDAIIGMAKQLDALKEELAKMSELNTKAHDELIRVEEDLAAKDKRIGELEQWVNDLQSGMYVNCVYCGHRYGPSPETPVAMADVLKAHIEQCPKHPMSQLKAELSRLRGALIGLVGSNDPNELQAMKLALDLMPIPQEERQKTINAIDAILKEAE